jgi:hypothetical protein
MNFSEVKAGTLHSLEGFEKWGQTRAENKFEWALAGLGG